MSASSLKIARRTSCVLAGCLACCVLAAQPASDDEPVTPPLGGGASVTLEPVADEAPTDSRLQRIVFVCREASGPVFSDRPCSPATGWRSLEVTEPPSGAVATTVPPAPPASTRPKVQSRNDPAPGGVSASRCQALHRQLEHVDDKMRAGYSAREAARLWNRWRDLKSRLRAEHC
jgi:hypothetical protein